MKKVIKRLANAMGYDVRKSNEIVLSNADVEIGQLSDVSHKFSSVSGFKVIDQDREFLYQILAEVYSKVVLSPTIIEIGVLRGDNAKVMFDTLKPKELYLVDAWSKTDMDSFELLNKHRDWVEKLDVAKTEKYFGGPLDDQATFDRLLSEAKKKFETEKNVQFIRTSTADGASKFDERLKAKAQLIYVDANHQYETVLDDLIDYLPFLDKDYGVYQLNDCCHSEAGIKQNLGVLEASYKFCRMYDFIPLVVVNRDFTDVLLARKGSVICELIDSVFKESSISFVELPFQLYPAAAVKKGFKPNLSFV